MKNSCDVLIVGAGFSGLVLAERLSTELQKRVIIIDRRSHLGGNAYDEVDAAGVRIHKYGPHYFRTNSALVREYLSRFTEWHPVEYKIKSFTGGRYWSFPINLNTFEELLGRPSSTEEMEAWLAARRVPIANPKNSEEVIISQVGWELYEMFFKGYTLKQWQRHPRELDASVCGRIPIRTNRDDRYLREDFQALPKGGYTEMFRAMLAAATGAELWLETGYAGVKGKIACKHVVFSGAIDEYYDYRFGALPYRSLRFEPQSFAKAELESRLPVSGKPCFWQAAMQVNYPNSEAFTRIVEIKHATGQQIEATTIVREYPENYAPGQEAYYPIPAPEAQRQYQAYRELAEAEPNVSFIGRLANYKYYNMDQVVATALTQFNHLSQLPHLRKS
jgi:UDP-galactopyranose mutase